MQSQNDLYKKNLDRPVENLASRITKNASIQTYYIIRLLVDRDKRQDAYKAYAYFRWADDRLDNKTGNQQDRRIFLERQLLLVERSYQGDYPRTDVIEEQLLVDLIRQDNTENSGLQAYIRNMMAVLVFDTGRRGQLVSEEMLQVYTRKLSISVTEALFYFIGNGAYSPGGDERYHAVSAAHLTHMLRDMYDDVQAGYYNIPKGYLDANHITPFDLEHEAMRNWVCNQVKKAREMFYVGKQYICQVESLRCRIAGYAYVAQFESVLDKIEKDDYSLRFSYPGNGNSGMLAKMIWNSLTQANRQDCHST